MFWKGKTSFISSWTKSHFMKNANCTSCIHVTILSVLKHQTRQTESEAARHSRPSCLLPCHVLTLQKFIAMATQHWVISKLSLTKHLCVHRRKYILQAPALLFWGWYLARYETHIFTSLSTVHLNKGKVIPVTGHEGPRGCETSRLPHLLDKRLTDGGKVVSLTRRPPFTSHGDSWYSFLLEAESTPWP
jgi:hypothetical protein